MSSLIKIDILTQLQLVMLFLTLWRIRKRKSLLSLEYTHELLLWAFFAGFTLILFFLITIQVVFPVKEIIAKFPWATITTLFAAPFLLIAFYWKHLQTISDRFIPASELIYDELPKKRVSGYLQLERVSVENLSLVPTVVELLSQNIQYMPNDSPDLKYALDILSRIWQYHSTR